MLTNVVIDLWQNGLKQRRIGTSGSGTSASWTVPDNYSGDGFTIQVIKNNDLYTWAESAKFSIVPDAVDLSGKWDVKFKLSLDDESGNQKIPTVTIAHNVKKGTLTMDLGKDWGIWEFKAKNGVLIATKAPFPDLCNNLVTCTDVTKNEGTYDDKRFRFDLDGTYSDAFFGDIFGQVDLSGTRR